MTRFYKITIGIEEKYFKTLKALTDKFKLVYDNVYHKVRKGKIWTNGKVIVKRIYFEE